MHDWNVAPKDAIAIQKELRTQVRLTPLPREPRTVGGADVSMNRFAKHGFAGFVTLSYPDCAPVDHAVAEGPIDFPYIPGLLSFREIPLLLSAWERLKEKPDVIVVDGAGIAHPRRLGIASHLGLILNVPTIGCAKSVLTGTYEALGEEPGSFSYLYDRTEVIGAAIRTKRNVKPVIVSPGHLITLEASIEIVLRTVRKHRLPEPTRQAHNCVNEYRLRASARSQDT